MIQVLNVSKTFPGVKALDNLSCSIKKGSIYGLIGSNGSGKSTLLRLLSGIYKPDCGIIKIDEQPVFENTYNKGRAFFLSDEPYVLPNYSIKDMARYYKIFYPNWSDERFNELCNIFKLPIKGLLRIFQKECKNKPPSFLACQQCPTTISLTKHLMGLTP